MQGVENEPVVITGLSRGDVLSACSRVELMVESSRRKMQFTHFISVPLNTPAMQESFLDFKAGFFLYAPKKTETEKLSFFKKLRLKIEKKLKTEPKKLRSLEALCSEHSPKNSDYWRPYLVT